MAERPTPLFQTGNLKLIQGDITALEVDAIVNAANNQLWMGGGVAGAIKRKGGIEIETEAVKKGPIEIGEAIETKAGQLKAKYVIHAATMGTDFKTSEEIIKKATLSALKRAEELKLKNIAFPALGTGVGGFSLNKCAQIMSQVSQDFLNQAKSLREIIFVLYDSESFEIFKRKLQKS